LEQIVADGAVAVGDRLHQTLGADNIFAEIDRGNPEADNFSAHAVSDVDGIDVVPAGFRHGLAVFVERPADGGDVLIGGVPFDADGAEQGRVEPATVLISALEVEVGGGRVFRFGGAQGEIAGAGFEPDIEDVHLFLEAGTTTIGAFCVLR